MFHKRNSQATAQGGASSAQPEQGQKAGGQVASSADAVKVQSTQQAGVRDYSYSRGASGANPAFSNTSSSNSAQSVASNQTLGNTNINEGHAMSTPNENTQNQSNNAPSRPMDIPGSMPYGRPGASGSAYGMPAQGGNAAYNPYGSGRKLIIGEGITMSGEIEHCDHLIVEGTVQATLKDAKLLDISEAGVFYGTVDIEEATIAGRFEGDINVNGRLSVKSTGVITGSISYKELAVEAGASIEGTLSPAGSSNKDDNVAAADFSKGKAVAKQARDAQKSGEQLPFSGKDNAATA